MSCGCKYIIAISVLHPQIRITIIADLCQIIPGISQRETRSAAVSNISQAIIGIIAQSDTCRAGMGDLSQISIGVEKITDTAAGYPAQFPSTCCLIERSPLQFSANTVINSYNSFNVRA